MRVRRLKDLGVKVRKRMVCGRGTKRGGGQRCLSDVISIHPSPDSLAPDLPLSDTQCMCFLGVRSELFVNLRKVFATTVATNHTQRSKGHVAAARKASLSDRQRHVSL